MPGGSAVAHLYRPKLVTILRDGYGLDVFRHDLLAGLTVAIVALPLSMAIVIASSVTPERGPYRAIVSGPLVSALGGKPLSERRPSGGREPRVGLPLLWVSPAGPVFSEPTFLGLRMSTVEGRLFVSWNRADGALLLI